MRRVVVTLTVPDDTTTHDIATTIDVLYEDADATVWEYGQFWDDVADGVVTPERDGTTKDVLNAAPPEET